MEIDDGAFSEERQDVALQHLAISGRLARWRQGRGLFKDVVHPGNCIAVVFGIVRIRATRGMCPTGRYHRIGKTRHL